MNTLNYKKIEELKRKVEICESYKRELTNYLQKLKDSLIKGEITHERFYEIFDSKYNNKTISQWINYYDRYILYCNNEIKKHERSTRKNKVLLTISFILLIVLSLGIAIFITTQKDVLLAPLSLEFSETLNIEFIDLAEYEWIPTNPGKLEYVTISGRLEGIGTAKVFLNDLLILDTNEINSSVKKTSITGQIITEQVIESIANETLSNQTTNETIIQPDASINETTQIIQTIQTETVVKIFDNFCLETCDLNNFQLNNQSYKLKIEILNARLYIDKISYKISEIPKKIEIIKQEEKVKEGKKITTLIPQSLENTIISTNIPSSWKIKNPSNIRVHWEEGNKDISFNAKDLDNDKNIDAIDWTSPVSGSQTFIIIVITKVEHLDQNKNFISNIYEEVKELDGIWSETIPDGNYVRAMFEKNLTNENDITIYPRIISGTPKIEVYEFNKTELIAEFTNIKNNQYNKVLLTNLQGSQEVFDLKISGGSIEFDHIIDPITNLIITSCDVNDIPNTNCFNALSGDGGTNFALAKGQHIDAQFQVLTSVQSVTSASLFYDSWGSLSGTWAIYVKNVRDGSIICQITTAPENAVETRNSINCNAITPTQLQNGLWLQINNNDAGSPQNINLDYAFLNVDYVQLVGNAAPTIVSVTPIPNVDLLAGTTKSITFQFTAQDTNGASDLNDASASASFIKTGENTRVGSCSFVSTAGNQKTYSCTVTMQYYDNDGTWTISVTIQDAAAATATDSSNTFVVNLLKDITISPASISFPSTSQGAANIISTSDTTITNKGNFDSTNGNIQLTAKDLTGVTTPAEIIPATNFKSVGSSQAGTVCTTGTTLSNAVAVNILSANLPRGNPTDGNPLYTSNTETMRYCITLVPSAISSQDYTATFLKGNTWTIGLLAASIIIKRKRKKRDIEKNYLKEILTEVLDKKIRTLDKKLEKLLIIAKEKESPEKKKIKNINIPVEIFREKIGAAESLCKYLKENKGLKFSEISKLLNRDQRTIALNYKNAVRKKKEKLKDQKTKIYIPIEILSNRNLSILESVVKYLKEKGFKNSEIATLLKKDQRNIWIFYSRAIKKLKSNKTNI